MSTRALIVVKRGSKYLSSNVRFDGYFSSLGAELALNFATKKSALFLVQFSDLEFVDSGVVEVPKSILLRGYDFFLSEKDILEYADRYWIKYIYFFDDRLSLWRGAGIETVRGERSLRKAFSRSRLAYDRAVKSASEKPKSMEFLPRIMLSEKRPLLTRSERERTAEEAYEERIRIGLKEAYLRHFARNFSLASDEEVFKLFDTETIKYALKHLKEIRPLLDERGLKRLQEMLLPEISKARRRPKVL